MFSAAPGDSTDVFASYDADSNRVYITGNHARHRIVVLELPMGLLISGGEGTEVNGEGQVLIPSRSNPRVTVDLRGGNDEVSLSFCSLSDVTIACGDRNDRVSALFVAADSFFVDCGDGRDRLQRLIQVPSGQVRILNLP